MAIDFRTSYLGLTLASPLVASASPLTANLDSLRRLEDAGAAAAVLPSLFEEQLAHEENELFHLYDYQTESYAESLSYLPELDDYNTGPEEYLELIRQSRKALQIPVIASLNGYTPGGWVEFARRIEQAGADALELNIYFVPAETTMSSHDVEERYLQLVRSVTQSVKIPVTVKIGPQFSSIPFVAAQLVNAGAQGLVLFNRFLEPDINTETLEYAPQLVLSSRHELRLALRWIAIIRDQLRCSLAATGGIHTGEDVLKALLAGADVALLATSLLRHGAEHLLVMHQEMSRWLEERDYGAIRQLQGSMSRGNCPDPGVVERGNYMTALRSFTDWQRWTT